MKTIILAGGTGTRLHPATKPTIKQLLHVYDKPMIYYPLTTAILTGSREILIISTPKDLHLYQDLLGDGNQWGCEFSYVEQPKPEGIAQALILGEQFINGSDVGLFLGDNITIGSGWTGALKECVNPNGAIVFGHWVNDPERFGVVEFDGNMKALNIEEKPLIPKSNYAVLGKYYYDNTATARAKSLKRSDRNELEITDLNNSYLEEGKLLVKVTPRGLVFFDCGTPDSLLDASNFVAINQRAKNLLIGSPEEAAWHSKFIDNEQLERLAYPVIKNAYGQKLMNLLKR